MTPIQQGKPNPVDVFGVIERQEEHTKKPITHMGTGTCFGIPQSREGDTEARRATDGEVVKKGRMTWNESKADEEMADKAEKGLWREEHNRATKSAK